MLQYDTCCAKESCRVGSFAEEGCARDRFPVGMAYVPWQKIDKVYECLEQALQEGTLFPELNKPYLGRRVCPK